jgi:hypothetical protein
VSGAPAAQVEPDELVLVLVVVPLLLTDELVVVQPLDDDELVTPTPVVVAARELVSAAEEAPAPPLPPPSMTEVQAALPKARIATQARGEEEWFMHPKLSPPIRTGEPPGPALRLE